MRKRITKTVVEHLAAQAKAEGRTLFCRDTDIRGFGARATGRGVTAFFVEYRIGGRAGRNERHTVGRFGELTVDQARKEAERLRGDIRNLRSPAKARKENRRKIKAETFAKACERYLALKGTGKRSWPETKRLMEHDAVPEFGTRAMFTIAAGEIAALVDTVAQRAPVTARALFVALRGLFRWSAERGIVERNPMRDLGAPKPPKARDRVLTDAEIRAFWRAAERMGWPFGPGYQLLLLTAQRLEEVFGMKRSELNLPFRVWVIHGTRTKNGKPHVVSLAPQAAAIIETLPKWAGSDFVFTTTGKTAVSGFSKAKARIGRFMAETMGAPVPRWCTHDLRRTAATGMQSLGVPLEVTERILNHVAGKSTGGVAGIYHRAEFRDEQQEALRDWARKVDAIVSAKDATPIVEPGN